MSKLTKIETELNELFVLGIEIVLYHTDVSLEGLNIKTPKLLDSLPLCYNRWYSLARKLISVVANDRLEEFESYYLPKGQIKELTELNFTISHFLTNRLIKSGVRDNETYNNRFFANLFLQQIAILESIKPRLKSAFMEIGNLATADLMDSEIESCRELLKQKYYRAAGVICGVVLEKHLAKVCINRGFKSEKKNPTLADFNELLKTNGVIDLIKWREISFITDIRNLCGHGRGREPELSDVSVMIDLTNKIIKTLF